MARRLGSSAANIAERVDHAEDLLIGGLSPRRAEQELARRYGVSARQARRYLAKVRMRWDAERRLDDSGVTDPLDAEFARLDHALESDDVSVALRGVRRMNNFLDKRVVRRHAAVLDLADVVMAEGLGPKERWRRVKALATKIDAKGVAGEKRRSRHRS